MLHRAHAQPLSQAPVSLSFFRFTHRGKLLAAWVALLILCFAVPLWDLARFAVHSELYSHVLLIPFITAYLIWIHRRDLPPDSEPARYLAVFPLLAALACLGGYGLAVFSGWKVRPEDYLALMVLSLLLLLLGGAFLLLGGDTLRHIAFPLAFLIFTVPFPALLRERIETFFQYSSVDAASLLFWLAGTPVLRDEQDPLQFILPGIRLEVAPECSGIHSSLVLFITSLLAGYLFLRAPWKRTVLALAVIPLAFLRNGFRIFVLAELCTHINPDMINSPIHHQGGPIFFVLSLIPFFLLLFLLARRESRRRRG